MPPTVERIRTPPLGDHIFDDIRSTRTMFYHPSHNLNIHSIEELPPFSEMNPFEEYFHESEKDRNERIALHAKWEERYKELFARRDEWYSETKVHNLVDCAKDGKVTPLLKDEKGIPLR